MLSSTRFVAIALLSLFLLAFLLTSLLTLKTSALLNTFLPLRAPTAPIPLTLFPLHANLTSRSCTLQVHLTGTPSTLHLLTASILTHPNITTTNNNNNTNTISEREASLISTTSSASLHPTGATLTISSSLRHPLSITHLGSFLNDKDANAQWPLQIGYGDESWNPAQGDRCWLGPVARKPEGLKEKRALWEQDFECGFECAEEKAE
ncbi:hypothetical protein MMC20_002940 [Loxospora ochrophaea]|nr:hypothetical protein [Loxospora ochrophaea]